MFIPKVQGSFLSSFPSVGSTGSSQSHVCPSHSPTPAQGLHTHHRAPTPFHGTIGHNTTAKCLNQWSRFLHEGLSKRWWTPGTLTRVPLMLQPIAFHHSIRCPSNRSPENLASTLVRIIWLQDTVTTLGLVWWNTKSFCNTKAAQLLTLVICSWLWLLIFSAQNELTVKWICPCCRHTELPIILWEIIKLLSGQQRR